MRNKFFLNDAGRGLGITYLILSSFILFVFSLTLVSAAIIPAPSNQFNTVYQQFNLSVITGNLTVSAGNVSADFFFGDGSRLTGITASGGTGNSTYNNILNQTCPTGNYTYAIQINGTILCRSDVSGSGGGISAISGDLYITNTSGSSPTIRFNETQNNITISSIASQFNSTDFLLAVIQSNNASWRSISNSSYIVRTGDDGISGNFTINNGNFTINNGSLFFPLPATGACDIIFQITGRAMRFCRLNAAGSILTAEFTSNISNSFSQITMGVGSANSGDIFAGNGTATTDAYINSSVTSRVMAWNNFFPVLKPTNTPPACVAATEGLLFQNATSHTTCVCNSTTYNIVGSATRC